MKRFLFLLSLSFFRSLIRVVVYFTVCYFVYRYLRSYR